MLICFHFRRSLISQIRVSIPTPSGLRISAVFSSEFPQYRKSGGNIVKSQKELKLAVSHESQKNAWDPGSSGSLLLAPWVAGVLVTSHLSLATALEALVARHCLQAARCYPHLGWHFGPRRRPLGILVRFLELAPRKRCFEQREGERCV